MKLDFESNISTFVPGASDFADGVETNNNSAEVSRMLREGIEAAQSGKSSEARSLLLRVTEAEPKNEKAWLWLASISEYPEELLVFLNNVLKINPENERALEWAKATKSLLSKTFVQRGIDASGEQGDFAKQCFLQATLHDSENEMAWLWLASIAESDEEKASYLQRVLNINAENETAKGLLESMSQKQREAVFAQAEMFAARGENEQALYALEEYLRQSAETENAWVLKSFLVATFAEKLECFEQVLEANPENEMAKMNADFLRPMMEKSAPEQAESEAEMSAPEEAMAEESAEKEVFAEAESEVEMQSEAEFSAMKEAEFSEESHAEPQHFSMAEEEFLVTDEMDEEAEQPQAEFEPPEAHFEEPQAETEESAPMEMAQPQAEFEEPQPMQFEESQPMEAENSEAPQAEEMQFTEAESNEVAEEKFEAQEDKFEAPAEFSDEAENEGERGYAFFQPEEKAEDFAEPQDFFSAETQTFNSAELNFFQAENQVHADAQKLPQVYDFAQDSQVSEQMKSADEAESAEPQEAENSMESYLQSVESEAEVYEIEQSETVAENNYSHVFEAAENAPEAEESASFEAESPSYFDAENSFTPPAEMVSCSFCEAVNEAQSIVCHSCRAVLTYADLEMVLANHEADKEMIGNAICQMEATKDENGLSADEIKQIALGYLNLGNLPKGLSYLTEAAKMKPDDIVLSSQINALKIRAAEIEKQNAVHDLMPKNLTILVVDDSATVRKLISGKLEKSGHEVICAIDGIEALEKIRDMVPDLVLLDINMPRMDGYQVCKMIRSNEMTKDVPVVMISGKDGFFDKVRGRMAGTTGYITKPFGPETLMKTVETYIV